VLLTDIYASGFKFLVGWFPMLVLTAVKDGVLKERGFQVLFPEVLFLLFLLRFYSHNLSTPVAEDL
jgi:hypothetical protein